MYELFIYIKKCLKTSTAYLLGINYNSALVLLLKAFIYNLFYRFFQVLPYLPHSYTYKASFLLGEGVS